MKRLSWKYIAGLIDGEGCIDFGQQKGYLIPRLRINLTASSEYLLENIQNNFGGYLYKRKTDNPMWKDSVSWELTGRKILGVMQNVKQHLILKKNQAEFICQYIHTYMGNRFDDPVKGRKFRDACKNELKAMKKDPHRLSDLAAIYADAIVEMPDKA